MKKTITSIILMLIAFATEAQIKKGQLMIGGSTGFSASKSQVKTGSDREDGAKDANFYLSPSIAYFIIDGLALGANLNVSHYSSREKNYYVLSDGHREDYKYRWTNLSIGPLARYYYPLNNQMAFFGHFDFAIGIGGGARTVKNNSNTSVSMDKYSDESARSMNIGPGLTYFLTPNIGLEASLFYHTYRNSYKEDGEKLVNKNGGVAFKIGLQVFLAN